MHIGNMYIKISEKEKLMCSLMPKADEVIFHHYEKKSGLLWC